ncbi:MAG: hypothetical protein HGB05_12045 [Chloroflexi bacterium]|nr:hypothetical protein [Chloroflexota bacterium]
MAKQPKRSFLSLGSGIILNQSNVATTLSLYPALRLATVVAAMAFVVLFAGDLLISQSGGGSALQSIPAAAPAPVAMQAQVAPTQESEAAESPSAAATAPLEQSAPPAGASAKMSETAVVTEAAALSMPTATPEATAVADASNQSRMMLNATPEPAEPVLGQQADSAAEQSAAASVVETAPAPTIDLLRIIEIALLALAVVLGIATFVVRRRQV